MRINATLLLAALPVAAFVEADAFVSHPSPTTLTPKRSHHQKLPRTSVTATASNNKQRMESWSNTALEMSGGDGEAAVSTDGTATIPNEVFNLIKSIVGAGVLSLPAGAYIFIICALCYIAFNQIYIKKMVLIYIIFVNMYMLIHT